MEMRYSIMSFVVVAALCGLSGSAWAGGTIECSYSGTCDLHKVANFYPELGGSTECILDVRCAQQLTTKLCTYVRHPHCNMVDGTLVPDTGQCAGIVDHTPCDIDGDPCTVGAVCSDGHCVGSEQTKDCSDDDPDTFDICNANTGQCQHNMIDPQCAGATDMDPCDLDGDPCTVGNVCWQGQCRGVATQKDCSDDDPDTIDSCNPDTGACEHELIDPSCSSDADCEDDNPATVTWCDEEIGCLAQPAGCADSVTCGGLDSYACVNGLCTPVDSMGICNDGDPCTADLYDPATQSCSFPSKTCHFDSSCNPETGLCELIEEGPLCTTDEDCESPTVCAVGLCNTESGECKLIPDEDSLGLACGEDSDPQSLCTLDGSCEPVSCDTAADCPFEQNFACSPCDGVDCHAFAQVCGEDGFCRFEDNVCQALDPCQVPVCTEASGCDTEPLCGSDEVCFDGECAPAGTQCVVDSDCPAPTGTCEVARCLGGECHINFSADPSCQLDSDGDGVLDWHEVEKFGSDPNVPEFHLGIRCTDLSEGETCTGVFWFADQEVFVDENALTFTYEMVGVTHAAIVIPQVDALDWGIVVNAFAGQPVDGTWPTDAEWYGCQPYNSGQSLADIELAHFKSQLSADGPLVPLPVDAPMVSNPDACGGDGEGDLFLSPENLKSLE